MTRILAVVMAALCCSASYAQTDTAGMATKHFLEQYEGTWTEEVIVYDGIAGEPQQYTLTTVIGMVLDGQAQQWTQTGMLNGKSYESWNILSCDGDNGLSMMTMNNGAPGMNVLKGTWEHTHQSITLESIIPGDERTRLRQVIVFDNKDAFRVTSYILSGNGTASRNAEYTFSRQ